MTPQQPAAPSNRANPAQPANKPGPGPGEGTVNGIGIVLIAAYIVLLTLFSTYLLIKIWPRCVSTAAATPSPPPPNPNNQPQSGVVPTPGSAPNPLDQSQSGGGAIPGSLANPASQPLSGGGTAPASLANPASQAPPGGGTTTGSPVSQPGQPPPVPTSGSDCTNPEIESFLWRGKSPSDEVRLLLIVLIAGVLGGLLHAIRSLFWYVGQRDLRWSWVLMYVLLPFVGALFALAFYLVVRGGFFPAAKPDQSNPIAFAALAMLVGLFSAQAGLKLKEIFETVFSTPPKGAEAQPQTAASGPSAGPAVLKVSSVFPDTGSIAGGESVLISGTNFSAGTTVEFGGAPAIPVTFVDATTLTAATPPHAAGKVDIVATNPDGKSDTLREAYTYI